MSSVASIESESSHTVPLEKPAFTLESYPGFIVKGDTKSYIGYFKKLGGCWIPSIKAWLFDDLFRASVVDLQRRASMGQLPVLDEPIQSSSSSTRSVLKMKPSTDWREDVNAAGTRAGKRWVAEEQADLMTALEAHRSVAEIALEHKRTETAIAGRVAEIISELNKEGVSMDEIIERTGQPLDLVAEIIKFGPRGDWKNRRPSLSSRKLEVAEHDMSL
jgi:hypothetical protein